MKNFFKNTLIKIWPIGLIFTIILILFIKNYSPNTWLIGWDNLIPEFNLKINVQRSFFAVWQEYQGLGLLGGMGHAADLLHQIFIWLLSLILPKEFLRYAWTFLMLFIGSSGVYFLLKKLIFKDSELSVAKIQLLSFMGGAFYLLNLSTMQTFYVPFEAFVAHFASLPWLLLSTLLFFLKPNRKNGLFFITVLILATPHAYIPTLFVVYILSLFILIFSLYIFNKAHFSWKALIMTLLAIFIVNSFWLLPFLYFTLTNSGVALNAKINQMATQTVFLQNKAFGDIFNVMILKGFWFKNVDPNFQGVFTYMLLPWRNYLANPLIQAIGYLFFGIILTGVVAALKKGKGILIAFFCLFLFSFTMLTTSTPPFSFFDIVFRKIPLFDQAFRFPFTKFSILTSLTYSIFFALGIAKLTSLPFFKKINIYLINFVFFVLLIIFIFPMFQGHLLYEKEKLNLPKEYLQTFDYFKMQDQNTRIANLPQHTFWGWEFYKWGYGGSGFLWYGIKQPILDRAFDVWSRPTENYYWELSHALYSKDALLLKNVLTKYQIGFLLLDKNIINPPAPEALMTNETEKLLAQIPEIKKAATFGNIAIYKVNYDTNLYNFVYTTGKLPVTNQYRWGNLDKAYQTLNNYITDTANITHYYPFRSLFSAKNQNDQEYSVKENGNNIELSRKLTSINSVTQLGTSSFTDLEQIVYAQVRQSKNTNGTITISLLIKTPEIFLTQKDKTNKNQTIKIWGEEKIKPIFIIRQTKNYGYYVNINGVKSFKIEPFVYEGILGSTFLSTREDNVIVFSNKELGISQSFPLTKNDIKALLPETKIVLPKIEENDILTVRIPKIEDNYVNFTFTPSTEKLKEINNCDNFNKGPIQADLIDQNGNKNIKLTSVNAAACFALYSSTLTHDQGYVVFIKAQNIKGRTLHFWLLNEDQKYAPIDTYFSNQSLQTFIIQPLEKFGKAYSLHFDNISIEGDKTINTIGDIQTYPIPYNFLTSMVFVKTEEVKTNPNVINLSTKHPNESLYNIKLRPNTHSPFTLVLSQAFDNGWQAYTINDSSGFVGFLNQNFPFIFGQRIKNHVLINNWENGWIMDNLNNQETTLTIVYLPQYLEFLGFLFIPLSILLTLVFLKLKSKK